MNKKLKVGILQIRVVFSDEAGNLSRAAAAVKEAAGAGAEICVLPEAMDLGWANPAAAELATPIPGPVSWGGQPTLRNMKAALRKPYFVTYDRWG